MKRFACTLLCGALLLTFAGCGKEETKELTEKETVQTGEENMQATRRQKPLIRMQSLQGLRCLKRHQTIIVKV